MSEAKLSDRVRPNVEAAPWVCDEIEWLEAQNQALKAELKQAEDNAEQHELRANQYSAELEALRNQLLVVPPQCTDTSQHVKYRRGWNCYHSELARLNGKTVSINLLAALLDGDSNVSLVEARELRALLDK